MDLIKVELKTLPSILTHDGIRQSSFLDLN